MIPLKQHYDFWLDGKDPSELKQMNQNVEAILISLLHGFPNDENRVHHDDFRAWADRLTYVRGLAQGLAIVGGYALSDDISFACDILSEKLTRLYLGEKQYVEYYGPVDRPGGGKYDRAA